MFSKRQFIIVLFCLYSLILTSVSFQNEPNDEPIKFKHLKVKDPSISELGRLLDFHNWAKSQHLRIPTFNLGKSILGDPNIVTTENTYTSFVDYLSESIFLEQEICFRRMKKNNFEGELRIIIYSGIDCNTAQEYLLCKMAASNMTIEALSQTYNIGKNIHEIGNISFVTESNKKDDIRIKFIRDNIAVQINGNGCFASEAIPLAKKIDKMILSNPVITYEQLLKRKPILKNIMLDKKRKGTNVRSVTIECAAPKNQEILSIIAEVDGDKKPVKNNKIFLERKKGKTKIKITAITDEMLVSEFEKEIYID